MSIAQKEIQIVNYDDADPIPRFDLEERLTDIGKEANLYGPGLLFA